MAEDPGREILARVLEAWFAVFGKVPAMVPNAVRRSMLCDHDHSGLREVLHDIAGVRGEVNRRKLGWRLRRHAGRIVNAKRMARATKGSAER